MFIGKPGENLGQRIIMCDECLQNIINAAPLEMIMNRPGIKEYLGVKEIEPKEPCQVAQELVGKALEGGTKESLSTMKFNELIELATAKGLKFKPGMSKVQLIKFIRGDTNV
jgi:hypothetical protein